MLPITAVTHRIARITFRTETSAHLRRLHEDPYERFRVADGVMPDVRHRIHRVDEGDLTLPVPSAVEIQGAHRTPGTLEGPLLRAPAVRERVLAALAAPASAAAGFHPGQRDAPVPSRGRRDHPAVGDLPATAGHRGLLG